MVSRGDVGCVLNRVLRVVPEGIRYDMDPRHNELLARPLRLHYCNVKPAPRVKWAEDLDHGPAVNEPEKQGTESDTEHQI